MSVEVPTYTEHLELVARVTKAETELAALRELIDAGNLPPPPPVEQYAIYWGETQEQHATGKPLGDHISTNAPNVFFYLRAADGGEPDGIIGPVQWRNDHHAYPAPGDVAYPWRWYMPTSPGPHWIEAEAPLAGGGTFTTRREFRIN